MLQELKQESQNRWEAAGCHVREFCKQHKITVADAPGRLDGISASWREEAGNGEEPFITRARVHDLRSATHCQNRLHFLRRAMPFSSSDISSGPMAIITSFSTRPR